jgi:CRISPR-associated endonuclease/helicase Cas3
VRLKGLAGKTIIIDEVHAYDVYMSTLLERLLRWLAALGCRVVLLSATLPRSKRKRLLSQFLQIRGGSGAEPSHYPVITGATADGQTRVWKFPAASPPRDVLLTRIPPMDRENSLPDEWLALLSRLQNDGGCCAIICNTVKAAQKVFQAIHSLPEWERHCTLLHARFRLEDRHSIESRVLAQFGPTSERPFRHIVVATQIIEQSLDLDFDVMATELCPVDLLFQRIGRLHRHGGRHRPASFLAPVVFLIGGAQPSFGRGTQTVYDEYVLLKTWLALDGIERLTLPDDIARLVDIVYEEELRTVPSCLEERFAAAKSRYERRRAVEMNRAAEVYLPSRPDDDLGLAEITEPFDDDDLVAATRLGIFGTAVVCLLPHEMTGFDDVTRLRDEEVRRLIGKSIALRNYEIAGSDEEEPIELEQPQSWARHPILRGYRFLSLNDQRRAVLPSGTKLLLDADLGLIVEK